MQAAAIVKTWVAGGACLALVACQTNQGAATAQCGLGGAAITYIACKALGKSDRDCLAFATVVGVGGAAICYNYAGKLDARRKDLAGRENDLDARIKYTRGVNDDTVALNNELSNRVAKVTQSTDTLVAQIRQGRVNQQQLAQERQARDAEVKSAQAQVQKNEEALREVRVYRASLKQPSPDLDAAIARQQSLYESAEKQVQLLAAQRARI